MCVHVNQLPDECLLPIFDLISLSELLQLDRVCARWKLLLWSACVRRRTLVLIGAGSPLDEMEFFIPFNSTPEMSFDGRRGRPYYDLTVAEREASIRLSIAVPDGRGGGDRADSDFTELARIRHARLGGRLATYLTELFPRVNNLVVVHPGCDDDELSWLIGLVGSSWTLKTLKLWIRTENIDDQHQLVRTLLRSMALQQPSLRQLSLDIDRNGYDEEGNGFTFPPETYSFIGQLNVLQLYLGDDYATYDTIWDIVHRFDHTQLRHIGLGNYEVHVEDVLNDRFINLATKVRQIYYLLFGLYFEDAEQLAQFGARFAGLTALEIVWFGQFTFTQLATSLALLNQLTHLELNIEFGELQPKNPFALLVERGDDGGGDEEARPLSLPQVKILVLDIWTTSHRHFVSLSPRVFPSVEVIIVDNQQTECSICGPVNNNGLANREQNERCHQLLIRSLKKCFTNPLARLHAQRNGGEFVDWTDYVPTDDDDDDLLEIGDEEVDDEEDDADGHEDDDEDGDDDQEQEDFEA